MGEKPYVACHAVCTNCVFSHRCGCKRSCGSSFRAWSVSSFRGTAWSRPCPLSALRSDSCALSALKRDPCALISGLSCLQREFQDFVQQTKHRRNRCAFYLKMLKCTFVDQMNFLRIVNVLMCFDHSCSNIVLTRFCTPKQCLCRRILTWITTKGCAGMWPTLIEDRELTGEKWLGVIISVYCSWSFLDIVGHLLCRILTAHNPVWPIHDFKTHFKLQKSTVTKAV